MARNWFAGGPSDYAYVEVDGVDGVDDLVQAVGGAAVTFYNAREGGTQYTDLVTEGGDVVDHVTSSDGSDGYALGQIPRFQGPDGVWEVWASANGGSRYVLAASNIGSDLAPLVYGGATDLATHLASVNPHGVRVADLIDAVIAAVTDGQVLGWDAGLGAWRPLDVDGVTGVVKLVGDQTITGATILTAGDTADEVLLVQGLTGQTGRLLRVTDATGVGGLHVDAAAAVCLIATAAAIIPLRVKAAAGQTARLAEWQDSNGVPLSWVDADGAIRAPNLGVLLPYSVSGNVVVAAGKGRIYNDTGRQLALRSVRASVDTPPGGAAITLDINVNGSSIYADPGDRPTIADGAYTSGKVAVSGVNLADGAYVTVDVDTVGASPAGADLTVQLWAA